MTDETGKRCRRRCCESGADAPERGARGWGSLLEPAVLAVLGSEGAHGYDLRKSVEELTGGVCADPGGTYRLLRRLEEQGAVISAWTDGEHGPQRREYALTDDGRALLGQWRRHLLGRRNALANVTRAVEDVLGCPAEETERTAGTASAQG